MAKKTTCPITRAQFRAHAKTMTITIGEKQFTAIPKEFSTGSLGWNVNDKVVLEINGVHVPVQIGLNLTIVGSKELPNEPTPAPTATPAPTPAATTPAPAAAAPAASSPAKPAASPGAA
jgi:hypothetical protein